MIWALASVGCSQRTEQSASNTSLNVTNTNAAIAVSAQSLTNQINEPRASYTNVPIEIHEAAGADRTQRYPLGDQLRTSLQSDPALAKSANNVSAEIQGDAVIIRGSVKSEKEREEIEAKVRAITRSSKIKNELNVRDK